MKRSIALLLALAVLLSAAPADARDAVIEGKNDWLFAGWENLTSSKTAAEKSSIELVAEISRQLAQRGTKLIVMLIPLKPRYYEALLPDGLKISDVVRKRYDVQLTELRGAGVETVDLREAMKAVLTAAGVPCARHQLVRHSAEARAFRDLVGYPMVAKPPDGAGAKATFRLDNDADFDSWLVAARQDRNGRLGHEVLLAD